MNKSQKLLLAWFFVWFVGIIGAFADGLTLGYEKLNLEWWSLGFATLQAIGWWFIMSWSFNQIYRA